MPPEGRSIECISDFFTKEVIENDSVFLIAYEAYRVTRDDGSKFDYWQKKPHKEFLHKVDDPNYKSAA